MAASESCPSTLAEALEQVDWYSVLRGTGPRRDGAQRTRNKVLGNADNTMKELASELTLETFNTHMVEYGNPLEGVSDERLAELLATAKGHILAKEETRSLTLEPVVSLVEGGSSESDDPGASVARSNAVELCKIVGPAAEAQGAAAMPVTLLVMQLVYLSEL